MPAHFVLALMLAGILAVCFGIVLREIARCARALHEDEREIARLAFQAEVEREIAAAGVASAMAERPKLPARAPAPVLLLPPPPRAS